MRFTVRRKIVTGVVVIVTLGAVALLIVYGGLQDLHENLRELDERETPTVQAAYEMEINLVELAAHVLAYMENRDPAGLERIRADRRDFERFHAEYSRLSGSPQTRELAARIRELYGEFVGIANGMIANRDAEGARFADVMQNLEDLDRLIDRRLEGEIDRSAPGALDKLADSIDLEGDIGELGIWIANYRQSRRDQERDQIWENVEEFREQAARLRGNPHLTAAERRAVADMDRLFADTERAIRDVLRFDANVAEDGKRFEALRRQLDDLLDDRIQVLAIHGLARPTVEADAEVTVVARRAAVLLPLFLLSACAIAALLIVNVTRSVSRLMAGTEAIRSGELSARIDVKGSDELADLAVHFNHMVERLETTTVSKSVLEASEFQVRTAYEELQRQTADRERAEAEERRLRATLQRTEMLAQMGSLVAGVAHEARNPLFGISSTIDALEARLTRLGGKDTYSDHLIVLRREIARLKALTRELLDYGKPASLDVRPAQIGDILDRAMQACSALAKEGSVTISRRLGTTGDGVFLDADRMTQVFQNLLENAVHHSARGATVTVDVRRVYEGDGDWLRCQVVDEGPGIDANDLPHIFEPFFSRRARGTGLGLSIVERIVDQHGGRTSARNGEAGGTVLTVDLPLNGEPYIANTGGGRATADSNRR